MEGISDQAGDGEGAIAVRMNSLHPTFRGEARVAEMVRAFWAYGDGTRLLVLLQVLLSVVAFALVAVVPLQIGNLLGTALSTANAEREVSAFVDDPESLRRSTERLLLPAFPTTEERRAAFEAIRATEIQIRVSKSDELLDALFPGDLVYRTADIAGIEDPEDEWEQIVDTLLEQEPITRADLERLLGDASGTTSLEQSEAFAYTVNLLLVSDAAADQRSDWRSGHFRSDAIRLAVVVMLVFVLRAAILALATRNTLRTARRLQDAVFLRIHDSALVDAGALARPSMVSRCTTYVDRVQEVVLDAQVNGVPAVAALLLSTGLLVYIDAPIGLMMAGVIVLFEIGRRVITPRWSRAAHDRLDLGTALSEAVDDAIAHSTGTRASRSEERERSRFAERAERAARQTRRLAGFGEGFEISAFGLGQMSVMLAITIVGFVRRDLSIGEATAVILYVREVSMALEELPTMVIDLQEAAPYMRRLRRVLAAEQRRPGDPGPVPVLHATTTAGRFAVGRLDVDRASFEYADQSIRCSDVTITAQRGRWVVLAGDASSGIDAVMDLVAGLEVADHGRVIITDDETGKTVDLALCSTRDLLGLVAVLPDQPSVFEGTVAENISWPHQDVDAEAIDSAAERAGIAPWLASQPDGLDTVIGRSRQRLPLDVVVGINAARVLLSAAPIVLLHDPTDRIDRDLADAIWRVLRSSFSDRIVVMSTSQLDRIADDDLVVCMAGGRVVETGTRGDLIARSGVFARLQQRLIDGIEPDSDLGMVPAFAGLEPDALRDLSRRLVVERYEPGDLIYDVGDTADRVYLVADGIVDLLTDGRRVASIHRGFHFGDADPSGRARRTTAAQARTAVVLRSLHRLAVSRGVSGILDRGEDERALYTWLVRRGTATRNEMDDLAGRFDVDVVLERLVADGSVVMADDDGTARYRPAGSRRQTLRSTSVLDALSDD